MLVNVEKTTYKWLSRHLNLGQIWDTKIANELFENVAQNKYFGLGDPPRWPSYTHKNWH
jgi:hypothetical protein